MSATIRIPGPLTRADLEDVTTPLLDDLRVAVDDILGPAGA